jgi:outer membrane protein assembly factor BamA
MRVFGRLVRATFVVAALWCALAAMVSAQGQPPQQEQSEAVAFRSPMEGYEGLIVRSIEFRGITDIGKTDQHLRALIPQQIDQPLQKGNIRRAIQNLYATGRFADIQVEAERTQNAQVDLVFTARENTFVGTINIVGAPKRPNENQLVNATRMQLGELFTRDKVNRAVQNMKAVLRENGYYKADVVELEELQPDTQQVNITFSVQPGDPADVGTVAIDGNAGVDRERLMDVAHVHPGDTVSAGRTSGALERLRKYYQKKGRLEAQAAITDRKYESVNNTVDYAFRIERGPTVDVHVEGAKIGKGTLKKYVPVYAEGAIDDDLLNEGKRNLRDYFQTKGYFNVKVDWRREALPESDHLHVIYTIDKGDRHSLDAIEIKGNKHFSRDLIRERMSIRTASSFLAHGQFSQSMLMSDVRSIEILYKTNGFESVKITPKIVDKYKANSGSMAVVIDIDEGALTLVRSLKIEGVKAVSEDELRAQLTTADGQPYSPINIATDRDIINMFYFNRGFSEVQFQSKVEAAANDPQRMDVTYYIKEGRQVFVNRILLSGLDFTRPYVAQREIEVVPNQPLSQLQLLRTQQKLYDLGIFNEVDIAVQNPEGDTQYKNVLFDFHEAKRWTFNYGFGLEVETNQPADTGQISTAPAPGIPVPPNTTPPRTGEATSPLPEGASISPRVSFEVNRINFRGRDHTLSFKTHLGSLQKRALVSYDAPHWFDKDNLRLTFTAFFDQSRDVRTFSSERIEGSAQAEQVASRSLAGTPITTLLYRFTFRRVAVDPNSLVINPAQVPLLSKPVRVGMPSFTYIRDKRDDPIDTRKGNYTTFDTGVAATVFGSEANFGRFLIQNSTYTPIKKTWVLARLTRIGVEEPFGSGTQTIIPLPERFYEGGGTSHRGFALNQAGPRDLLTGFPVGGNAVLLNTIEMRFPPVTLPYVGDNLSFVLYHDAGNVFETGQDMVRSLFQWTQKNRQLCQAEATHTQCDFNYISHAAGLGLRYRTPIGPVRVDFSYNFNPTTFPYFVQPVNSTDLIFQSGTLRHFNFFLSIGQSF